MHAVPGDMRVPPYPPLLPHPPQRDWQKGCSSLLKAHRSRIGKNQSSPVHSSFSMRTMSPSSKHLDMARSRPPQASTRRFSYNSECGFCIPMNMVAGSVRKTGFWPMQFGDGHTNWQKFDTEWKIWKILHDHETYSYMAGSRREMYLRECAGGEGGIRTHGTLSGSAVFKTAAINRSATSPRLILIVSLACKRVCRWMQLRQRRR